MDNEDTVKETIKNEISDGLSTLRFRLRIHSIEPVAREPDYDLVWNIKLVNDKNQLMTFSLEKPPGFPRSWYKEEAMRKIQQIIN